MKKEQFERSPAGHLVPTERGQWAFVPHDLPPAELNLSLLVPQIAEASQLLGELNGIIRILPDPYLLIRPMQVREALTSSSIEGTYTTIDDLLLLEAGAPERNRTTDTREVLNYRLALSNAIESLKSLSLSMRVLKEAHRTLLSGVARHRGGTAEGGEFKQHQNFIGAVEIELARFVPPPPREAIAALDKLEKYIHRNDRGGIPDLVDAALIHYQFEAIHPFPDGNGRVGRMLIALHLFVRGLIREPVLYLSPIFERRKDEYIDRLYEVSRSGAWNEWVAFFLDVVAEASRNTIATSDALRTVQEDYRRRLTGARRSANLVKIVDLLFRSQVVTIPRLAQYLGVTYRAAQLNAKALVRVGILEEIAATANPRYYIAREIRDIISKSIMPHPERQAAF